MDNHIKLLPIELKLNGEASWDSQLNKGQPMDLSCRGRTWDMSGNPTEEATLAFFKCPDCTHTEPNTCQAFRLGDLELKQKCNACKGSHQVNLWKCGCGVHWHRCYRHRHCWSANSCAERPKRPRASTSQVCPKKSRASDTQTYEVMLTEDGTRAKRKQLDE